MIHVPKTPIDVPPFLADVINEPTTGGKFTPHSRIVVGSGIQALAKAIGTDGVGILAVICSFSTANGKASPSVRTLSRALGPLIRLRLIRLSRQTWRGQPVVHILHTAAGLEHYQPGGQVLARRESAPDLSAIPLGSAPAGRQAIIAFSRATYSRDRATVEEEIRAHNGWPSPQDRAEAKAALPKLPENLTDHWAVQRLVKEKVDYSLAVKLVKDYGAERVLQQVKWLDSRKAKNRTRYVVSAIISGYPPPKADA